MKKTYQNKIYQEDWELTTFRECGLKSRNYSKTKLENNNDYFTDETIATKESLT